MRLEGIRAVVTGSGRGIGRAIARAFAAEGAAVVVSARSEDEIRRVAREITGDGGCAVAVRADVNNDDAVRALECRAREALGGSVNVLVNNAGVYMANRFLDYGMDEWQRSLEVNVLGTVRVTRAFLPAMLEARSGRILNMASTAGKWGTAYQAAYNTAKHAILGLTRSLALETAARGVRVNAICPGWVSDTGFYDTEKLSELYGIPADRVLEELSSRAPIGRMVTPQEVAALAVYLASPEADAMTGVGITMAGGMILI